jgi:hypothetical protein
VGLSFLTPLFLAGLTVVAVPVIVHLIRRHRGTPVAFPSLMFLRRLPVRSVRRRRIRDWPLLLVRVAAVALVAAAFARPVLVGSEGEGTGGDAFREVVVVLDRSWSMGLEDRWERARVEVEGVLRELVSPDRVALVHFDGSAVVAVAPTLDPSEVRTVLDTLFPGWGAPRIGVGLQAAVSVLDASDRALREVVLVSDLQRRGWEDGPRDPLPSGMALSVRDVGGDAFGVIGVAEAGFRHEFVDGRQRVRPHARVLRLGGGLAEGEETRAVVTLRLDGRETESREVVVAAEGAASVEFEPFFVPPEGVRGSVEAIRASDRPMEPFRFVLSPDEVLTVLLVEGTGGPAGLAGGAGGMGPGASPYLRSALSVGGDAPLRVVRRGVAGLTPADLAGAHVVLLDDVPLPGGAVGTALRRHVTEGGAGLIVAAGPRSAPGGWEGAWDELLPGRPGAPVERNVSRGASLAGIDRDHPVFLPFTATGPGGIGNPRFFRYRGLIPAEGEATSSAPASRVVARFDDGSPALAERRAGEGRVLLWTSSLDADWSDLPLHAAFLPLVQEMVRYAGLRDGTATQFPVGRALDAGFLLARAGIEGVAADSAVLVAPGSSGRGMPLGRAAAGDGGGTGADGEVPRPALRPDLHRPGFYEVRRAAGEEGRGWSFAVNMEPAAADPARIEPEELLLAATGRPATTAGEGGVGAAVAEGNGAGSGTGVGARLRPSTAASPLESERRQGAWTFLLAGALLLLLAETVVSNRGRAAPAGAEGRNGTTNPRHGRIGR